MLGQKSILDMFGRSPLRPLQQHMHKAHACVENLLPFYEAIQQSDWDQSYVYYKKITELEHEADDLKRDLRLHLPRSLLLPVSRGDVLMLLSTQEMLANLSKDIAGIMFGRKMILPLDLQAGFSAYLQRSIDASSQALGAINELDELLESGFRGKEVSFVERMLEELNIIEHDNDIMQIALRQKLFILENDLKAVDVMFLYKIIDWVGHLADNAQQAGYQLQLLLAA